MIILLTSLVRCQDNWLTKHRLTASLEAMTEKEILSAAGKIMGSRTSARKAKSSARNGKLAWSKKRKQKTIPNGGKIGHTSGFDIRFISDKEKRKLTDSKSNAKSNK